MLHWQNPAALWWLALAALPVVIHLLRTHHAKRVAFPTLRFVQPSRTAAVRMRLPSDIVLMLVRMSIVACAAAALAGPIVLSSSRLATWDARVARAIVIDNSESMRASPAGPPTAESEAAAIAQAETRTATYTAQFDAADLHEAALRASRWLADQPPARRELVVISDLQQGAIEDSFADAIGEGVGLRFARVGRTESKSSFEGLPLLGPSGARGQRVDITAQSTSVAIEPRQGQIVGLRILAPPGNGDDIARLLRVVARAGAFAGSAAQPIVVRFAGAPADQTSPVTAIKAGWMLRAALRLKQSDDVIAAAASRSSEASVGAQEPWTIVLRGAKGQPIVRAADANGELVIDVAASPNDIFAAAVTRAALDARTEPSSYDEREVSRVDDGIVAAMTRPAEPVKFDAWRNVDATDARWCWLLAVLLMGVEQWLRTLGADQRAKEVTRAAA